MTDDGRQAEVPAALPDPRRWGRVDGDGAVYVYTAGGECRVGLWQAGTAEQGLEHFARRFDDMRTEAELLRTRLSTHAGDPKQVRSRVAALRSGLGEPTAVGDIDGLAAFLDELHVRADRAIEDARRRREQARDAAIARKEELAAEAERIGAESTRWKADGERLRAILDEWRAIKGIDRKTDDALWHRFSKAREAFNRRRGAHFAELDRQRGQARERKEQLTARAEELADSTAWGQTAAEYKSLMAEWKAAGRAPKDADEALWRRFRAAQNRFFDRRSEEFSQRDAELAENARAKEELLAEAEAIDPDADLDAARARLRDIQQQWERIGKVPKQRIKELEGRLRSAEQRLRSAADTQWRRADPDIQARVAQFRERVEQFEQQAAKARAGGDEGRAEHAEAQARQWREWLAAAEQALASR